jgi:dipeptidyl aminopeptidase/acylaminoacyl peptidase
VVLRVQRENTNDLYEADLDSFHPRLFSKPSFNAVLVGFVPESQVALFTANDRSGSYMWISDTITARTRLVVETNTFLRNIAQGEFRRIEYVSLDNQPLAAWILLPLGYKPGHRYPMIASVYPDYIAGRQPPTISTLNSGNPQNLQLLAAQGYAVLFPSMPLPPVGVASDPMLELTKGVLPALDKAIEIGIADSERLGVMGQSYGGYATYGLVTQTTRFKAAVSMAGISNLISLYGEFDARTRYDADLPERFFQMVWEESAEGRMGGPPWKDAPRYVRNSPVFSVDRVNTPVLIIQGDMDYVAMQQGEEFFAGLYRQGKRASFVRYLGEGHVVQGPANVRDMWQRIFAWFDEFLDSRDQTRPSRP